MEIIGAIDIDDKSMDDLSLEIGRTIIANMGGPHAIGSVKLDGGDRTVYVQRREVTHDDDSSLLNDRIYEVAVHKRH